LDNTEPSKLHPTRGVAVDLRNVSRRYPNGTVALNGVTLRIHSGESVAIVGRSGSGKSTLLNILGLLDQPSEGEVWIQGRRTDAAGDAERSNLRAVHLGFVFQRAHLMTALSVRENAALGYRYAGVTDEIGAGLVESAIDAVGLRHRIDAAATTLSGGEMQRAAIARTLARPAQIWLADEPTGNLDSGQSLEIIELLKARAKGQGAALIVVTHEPEIADRLDRTVTLIDGVIVDDTRALTSEAVDCTHIATNEGATDGYLSSAKRTLFFVYQSLRAYRRRAWTGIAAASLAVAMIVVALGLAQSAASQVTNLFDAQRATQVTARFTSDTDASRRWPISIDKVASYPGVVGAELWRYVDQVEIANASAANVTSTVALTQNVPGSPTESSIRWAKNHSNSQHLVAGEVILGETLADRLHVTQVDLEPAVVVNGQSMTVVGILTSSRVATGVGLAFLSTQDHEELLAKSLSSEVFVKTTAGAARQTADRLPKLVDPYSASRVEVDPVLSSDAYRGELEGSVSTSLSVLAVVASLAGLVAVIFVNLISVSSRTAEFGVRRAFGARKSELIFLVVGESAILSVIGAIVGLLLGFLTIMTVSIMARWQPIFEPRLLLIPIVAGLVFGLMGGIAPAIAAGKIQPADAVRV
jgi:macrolide transport system ATP-binding/permease protein